MSTAATYEAPLSPRADDRSRDHQPGLVRLTRVELRKMYDTRAGFWLLLSCALLTLLTVGLTVFTGSSDARTLGNVLDNSLQAVNVLVPVVGILLVTSEWSQRTAQITFTLVPRRGHVLTSKVAASLVLALFAFVAALGLSALGTALRPSGAADTWSLSAGLLGQMALFTAISMLIGVALGAAILLSAPAIVASFVLPLAFGAVTHLVGGLDGLANWLDQGENLSNLTAHVCSAHEWARIGTTVLLWLVVPLVVGVGRFLRGEIR